MCGECEKHFVCFESVKSEFSIKLLRYAIQFGSYIFFCSFLFSYIHRGQKKCGNTNKKKQLFKQIY